jgi:hypothetical protein
MSSISVSDYRQACKELLKSVMHRPQMYFETLRELELIMQGHATAFEQMMGTDQNEMFPSQFRNWLHIHEGMSCSGGWASAIEERCRQSGESDLDVFKLYVNQFIHEWS